MVLEITSPRGADDPSGWGQRGPRAGGGMDRCVVGLPLLGKTDRLLVNDVRGVRSEAKGGDSAFEAFVLVGTALLCEIESLNHILMLQIQGLFSLG